MAPNASARIFANAWLRRGMQVTLLTLADTDRDFYAVSPGVRRIGLRLVSDSNGLVSALVANLRRIARVRRVLTAERPDIVLSLMPAQNVIAVLAGFGLGIAMLVSEHVHPPAHEIGRVWARLRAWVYPRASAVVALTEESRKWLESNCAVAPVRVIPNPVNWPLPTGQPVLAINDIVDPSRRIVLAVGRMQRQKGFDLLLDAFARVAPVHREWDLVILGDGEERTILASRAAALGIADRVLMPGRVGNLSDWYERADLFVLSSRYEGFGNVLVEAMASGTACISFDCPTGPRDIIRDGVDGILVPPADGPTGLAAAIERLIVNQDERSRMAAQARDVLHQYSEERILAMWDEAFRCALERRRRPLALGKH
ncbi:MAG: glycosyltransferase family 4 protein [Burkholderiaceae bacterium]|nr:glycosyltransferase family 4 protein [Burkholderiaceae bacterium]